MLVIRNAQLESLRLSRIEPYKHRVRQALTELITPERLLVTRQQLDKVVDVGVSRAGNHGFTTEKEVFNLIAAMVVFGPDFDTGPLKAHFIRSLDRDSPRPSAFRADDLLREVGYRLEQNPNFRVCNLPDLPCADAVGGFDV